ncbi:hypothetical protein BDQ17DRAFT_1323849 [Cyathus striatus]|nr:hypothetical protein BDQ17DRAFT_1323849 [Cyathus striatus]
MLKEFPSDAELTLLSLEIKPDVFVNNRISATLDSGKSVEDIIKSSKDKYTSAGFAALCSHHVDVNHKCSAIGLETLRDPVTGFSTELTDTAFCRAYGTGDTFGNFWNTPKIDIYFNSSALQCKD